MPYRIILASAALAALTACQTTTATAPEAAAPTMVAVSSSGVAMGSALNAARTQNGRSALSPSAALMAAAEVQARHMAATGTLTHTGPGGSNVGQRVRQAGCSHGWVAENVYMGGGGDQAAMDFWMTSSGHRSNALNPRATAYGSASVGGYRALVLAAGC